MNGYVNGEYWFSFETGNPAVVSLLQPFYASVSVAEDSCEQESLKDRSAIALVGFQEGSVQVYSFKFLTL